MRTEITINITATTIITELAPSEKSGTTPFVGNEMGVRDWVDTSVFDAVTFGGELICVFMSTVV